MYLANVSIHVGSRQWRPFSSMADQRWYTPTGDVSMAKAWREKSLLRERTSEFSAREYFCEP